MRDDRHKEIYIEASSSCRVECELSWLAKMFREKTEDN